MPRLRYAGAAYSLRRQRDQLLSALSDGRKAARRSRAVAIVEAGLAQVDRRADLELTRRRVDEFSYTRGCTAAITFTPSPASDCPPSQTTTVLVMKRAPSLDRKSARSAISSFVANRRSGTPFVNCSRISGVGASRRMPSVSSTAPGAIEFTRTP